ncbi:MAG: 2-amino-4-hydroxy-6-hydroxymethyldihydropteridine diphosphokinase [Wenzhouxiangella sp.]|jgi:2-amino-4-hydroxy-6-hydroxymethyldihydropteridine diphosphokinase|nr:2-amino-4-hydroxy-6-hydroxymethyldihydropteridine diphosphokinase [Wenzhouxiangella sp.]
MSLAWVGLGANLGRPKSTLNKALAAIDALPQTRLLATSPFYWTTPWGLADQPDFLNAVACLQTAGSPIELLRGLLAIESGLGRVRTGPRWGPREVDLDLLLFDDLVLDSAELTLPHPRLHERGFVLVPLAELAPDLIVPGKGRVIEQLESLPDEELDSVRLAGESPGTAGA